MNGQITLRDHLDEWYRLYKAPMVRNRTAEMYCYIISLIWHSDRSAVPVDKITEADLQIILNAAAADGYSKSVIEKMRLTLRQAYRPLVRQGIVSHSPATDLILPLAPQKEVLPLTHAQQEAVELACRDDPLGHLLLFLLDTGLRRGEMMALTWSDYDADEHSIFIAASKTPAGIRKVYLTCRAVEIVEAQPRISAYIFTHTKGGQITKTVMRRLVDRIRRRSGVTELACHVCRHTFVTRLCEQEVPAKAIAQIIGHAKTDYVLDIYAKMEADELRKAIYALEPRGRTTALIGGEIHLPAPLYETLCDEAQRQKVSVDVLASYLLSEAVRSAA